MSALNVTIDAGPHARRNCPITFQAPDPMQPGAGTLISAAGERVPVQIDAGLRAACIMPELAAGAKATYRFEETAPPQQIAGVAVNSHADSIAVSIRDQLLTRYQFGGVPARPYFYPLLAPGQIPVTRSFPMEAGVAGETQDHPHHRSLWIAFGEVNGADNWSEEANHGFTRPQGVHSAQSGSVFGGFKADSIWTASDGTRLVAERLEVTAWNTDETLRLIDFKVTLSADFGDVQFGDTKEGGILSVRVASELDVPRTGVITNVYGGTNEGETWGKASHWCDYSGTIDGEPVGIAVMDHPDSFRYPTHWHVRNYGLMTANPFGYAAYTNGAKNGSHLLMQGGSLCFRYRIVLHRGNCSQADVNGRYLDFVSPPKVTPAE